MANMSATLILVAVALVSIPSLAEANSGDFSGGVAIGNGYAGVDGAPTNGAIIQGNVGIGTTSPAGTLDVEGGTAAASTNGTSINLVAQSAGTGNQNGGSLNLTPGAASGTGTPGYVIAPTAAVATSSNQVATTAFVQQNYSGGFINKLRNGNMLVSQRMPSNTSTACSTTPAYTIDGWICGATGANAAIFWEPSAFTATSGNYPAYIPAYAKIEGAASNTAIFMEQRIEAYDAASLAGENITVQFQFYNDSGASITPTIQTCYASARDNFTTCTADLAATNMQTCANATTCTEAYTLAASASAVNGYQIRFNFGAMTSASDVIEVTGFDARATPGVAAGTNAAPPIIEQPTIQAELERDQRYDYYWSSNAAAFAYISLIRCYSTTQGTAVFRLPVTLRAVPTMTSSAVSGSTWDYGVTSFTLNNGISLNPGIMNMNVVGTFTGAQYSAALGSLTTTTVWINFSSEL
jgi:hypothetical protein